MRQSPLPTQMWLADTSHYNHPQKIWNWFCHFCVACDEWVIWNLKQGYRIKYSILQSVLMRSFIIYIIHSHYKKFCFVSFNSEDTMFNFIKLYKRKYNCQINMLKIKCHLLFGDWMYTKKYCGILLHNIASSQGKNWFPRIDVWNSGILCLKNDGFIFIISMFCL